jgi:membrane protease YdiL (CAAX protease family)
VVEVADDERSQTLLALALTNDSDLRLRTVWCGLPFLVPFLVGSFLHRELQKLAWVYWIYEAVFLLIVPLLSVYWGVRWLRLKPAHFGWSKPGPVYHFVDFTVDAVLAFSVWKIAFVVLWSSIWVATAILTVPFSSETSSVMPSDGLAWLLVVLLWSLGPGLLEELFLRGLLRSFLQTLTQSDGIYIFMSGLLFGLGHLAGGYPKVIAMFFIGAIFAGLFVRMRTIWPLAFAHSVVNLTYFLFGF